MLAAFFTCLGGHAGGNVSDNDGGVGFIAVLSSRAAPARADDGTGFFELVVG